MIELLRSWTVSVAASPTGKLDVATDLATRTATVLLDAVDFGKLPTCLTAPVCLVGASCEGSRGPLSH